MIISGTTKLAALVAVLGSLFNVVDIASRALADQLLRVREARDAGLGWLDAWRIASRPAIAGGTTWIDDLKNNLVEAGAGNSIVPQTATATVTGAAIDLQSADGICGAAVQAGAVSGTAPTLDVKVQESDTSGGTYTDIAGATFTQITAANKSQVINFKRSKRFVRLVATIGGTTPSFALAGQIYGVKKAV